jgi:hypothetical protein
MLECALVGDRLHVAGVEHFEMAARRFQLWEEFYAHQLKQVDLGGGAAALDERRHFLGARRSTGLALIFPALETHVASKIDAEAQVLKARRKAREEQRLAAGEVAPLSLGPAAAAAGRQDGKDDDGDGPKGRRRRRGAAKKGQEGGQ